MKNLTKKFTIFFNKYIFPFYNSKDIKLLFKKLEANEKNNREVAMFVGGCVRNFLQSKKIDDIDIATIFTPEELKKKLKDTKFKIIDTSLDHGSITVVSDEAKFELTTLRKDFKTDGRHAEIIKIDNWKEDSKRRDFTINAIYLNKKGKIFDPQLGLNDLKNNIVKFIGDPATRIEEDFLRIIRFIRFSLQYSSSIELSTIKAIKLNLNGLKILSKERILTELLKILKLQNFSKITEADELNEIFKQIFPEFSNIDRLKKFKFIEKEFKISEMLMLAILLIGEKNNHEYFLHKYRVSKKISDGLILLGNQFKVRKREKEYFKKNLKKNLYHCGLKNMKILYCLNLLDKKKITNNDILFFRDLEKIRIPKFPYDGSILLKKGFKEGKNIGKILAEAEKIWINNDFNLSMKNFENIIKDYQNN